jgi:hypothetical protein
VEESHEVVVAVPLAGFAQGQSDVASLQDCLDAIWVEVLSEPETRDRIAGRLGIAPERVDRLDRPLRIRPDRAGLTGVEIGIIIVLWVSKDILLGAVEAELKDQLRQGGRWLWLEVIRPRFHKQLPRHALGREMQLKPESVAVEPN